MPLNTDWWVVLNRVWLMAAATNLLWSLVPQLMLFMPNMNKEGHLSNVTSVARVSSLVHRPFSEERRLQLREEARRMFYWGYDNYMIHAFPFDELNPINCSGRGHDWDNLYVEYCFVSGISLQIRNYESLSVCAV